MEELERTYLAKELPAAALTSESKEILDIYIPISIEHPILRIRKSDAKYEMTKKVPVVEGDASRQLETTISLSNEEFGELEKISGKKVRKRRYFYTHEGSNFEIDVFQDALAGLVLVDIEFTSVEQKDAFLKPEFCLAEVTQEKFIAGGMLCGKSYADIEGKLQVFGYKKIIQ